MQLPARVVPFFRFVFGLVIVAIAPMHGEYTKAAFGVENDQDAEFTAPKRITLSIELPADVEWRKNRALRFDLLDKDHKFVCKSNLIAPLNDPVLIVPANLSSGFIKYTIRPCNADTPANFVYLEEPIAFDANMESLSIRMLYKKPAKFTVKLQVPKENPPLRAFTVVDVTDQGSNRFFTVNDIPESLPYIEPDKNQEIVFYGAPDRTYAITAKYGDNCFEWVYVSSPDLRASGGQDTVHENWKIAKRQLIAVKLVVVEENRRSRALDINSIGVNGGPRRVKDSMTFLNPADAYLEIQEKNGVAHFWLDYQAEQAGYTKILSGETLKITPDTKEHIVVLSKEHVEAEITFAATDASSGEKLAAKVYYAQVGTDSSPRLGNATLTLAPGNYQIAVAAPGYDFLPLALEVKKKEKRTVECKLQKSRTVTVSVKYPGEVFPGGKIPGIYTVLSPAASSLNRQREQPLETEFTVPFDPRLGNCLCILAKDVAPQVIPLDAQTPEKLTVNLTKGVKVTGKFSPEFGAHVETAMTEISKNIIAPHIGQPGEANGQRPLVMLLLPDSAPYIHTGGAKARPGEPWETTVMSGRYRIAMDNGLIRLHLPNTVLIPDKDEMAFPEGILTDKVKFEAATGEARSCTNDLFRRLSSK